MKGIYDNPRPQNTNPLWEIPEFPEIYVNHTELLLELDDQTFQRRITQCFPARLFPSKPVRYRRLNDCIAPYENQNVHTQKCQQYLSKLFSAGILYRRKHQHEWELAPKNSRKIPWQYSE